MNKLIVYNYIIDIKYINKLIKKEQDDTKSVIKILFFVLSCFCYDFKEKKTDFGLSMGSMSNSIGKIKH
jgi:hypothetical protein